MAYVTVEADRDVILKDIFVVEHWHLIEELVDSVITLRVFEKLENGKTDKLTWVGVDYKPLLNIIV